MESMSKKCQDREPHFGFLWHQHLARKLGVNFTQCLHEQREEAML